MGKAEEIKQRIVGKTKQAVGEIIGDQSLHDDGKAQARGGDGPRHIGKADRLKRHNRSQQNSAEISEHFLTSISIIQRIHGDQRTPGRAVRCECRRDGHVKYMRA